MLLYLWYCDITFRPFFDKNRGAKLFEIDLVMQWRTEGPSIDEYLDSEYHSKVPWLPDVLRDNDTDNYLAWKWGCIAVKASMCFLLKLLSFLFQAS